MYSKSMPVLTFILVLCSATVNHQLDQWPNSDEDPLMFIANPVEAEIPGHWIPLSILKAILQKKLTTLPRPQPVVTKTQKKTCITKLHTSKPNPPLKVKIYGKKKEIKQAKSEDIKDENEKDKVIKENSKAAANIKEKGKEDRGIKEKCKVAKEVKENKQDNKVENKEAEEKAKTETKGEEPEQVSEKGEITDEVVGDEYEEQLHADDPIPADDYSDE